VAVLPSLCSYAAMLGRGGQQGGAWLQGGRAKARRGPGAATLSREAGLGARRILGKMYNLCRVKSDISAMLTVKSGLDPHMINELEDELNREPCLWLWLCLCCICSLSFNVGFGMNLYLNNQVLIKLDQLKLLIAVSQSAFPCFWPSCHIISNTC
jgi:hypothetical protein